MKRIFLTIALALSCIGAAAQKPVPADFKAAVDSMQVLLRERTGVEVKFGLNRITRIGRTLDFYFTKDLGDFPWRPGDVKWFRRNFVSLSKGPLRNYDPGILMAGNLKLDQLEMPEPGYDGRSIDTPFRVKAPESIPLVRTADKWPGGLSGRHIALWQSHGLYFDKGPGRWVFQRPGNHSTAEDLYTQSYVLPFLVPMLENAGAVTMTPRERDTQRNEVVCDNDPAFPDERTALMRRSGTYSESGKWSPAGEGFADAKPAYEDHDNPFTMGTARKASGGKNDRATWKAAIPEPGEYAVYVSYKTLPESTTDAVYTVLHRGGESTVHVNQKMGGGTWIYIGTYSFADKGEVRLSGASRAGTVTADAVRFGGGMGKADRGAGISGMPAYVEGALSSMQYGGTPLTLFDDWDDDYTKDFAGRGRWVKDLTERGIPFDCSLAFHSDAGITPDSTTVGTLAIYTYRAEEGTTYADGSSRLAARLLTDFVQTQVVADVRRLHDPLFSRRGTWDRSYSESRTTGVPGMLLEILSHQNFADMRHGLDPQFRFDVSRAVYKGILKFLSARYGCNYTVQPLPVHGFSVKLDSPSEAVLSWTPTRDSVETTATPTGYRVYTRVDNGVFDNGVDCKGTSVRMKIQPGHLYSWKVVAYNAGGLSFPSEILAAGTPGASARKVVVVNAFTRVSAPTSFDQPQYAGFTHNLDSGVPWGRDLLFTGEVNQFRRDAPWTSDSDPGHGGSWLNHAGSIVAGNTFDFVALHGKALLDAGYAFESSSAEAWDGAGKAFTADIICGKQVTTRDGRGACPDKFTIFTPALQDAISAFVRSGGNIIISGSYIATDAWDSIYQGVPRAPQATRDFVKNTLGYGFVTNYGDHSGRVLPMPDYKLPSVTYNRDYSPAIYRIENPDGISPAAGSRILMRYGSGITAATLFSGPGYKVAAFGFPLETSNAPASLLQSTLELF